MSDRFAPHSRRFSRPVHVSAAQRNRPLARRFLVFISLLTPLALSLARETAPDRFASLQRNSDFLTARGEGGTLEEARRQAEKALLSQIQTAVTISSSYRSEAVEDNQSLRTTTEYNVDHQNFTSLFLKGLRFEELEASGGWRAIAYIHRDSLAASFALRKQRILGLSAAATEALKRGNVGEGLRSLYLAWLLAKVYPDTLELAGAGITTAGAPAAAIASRISLALDRLDITAGECYRDPPVVVAPLHFRFDGAPVADLSFTYYSGGGMEYGRVKNGRADVPLEGDAPQARRTLLVSVEFAASPDPVSEAELAALAGVFGAGDFLSLKSVELLAPWLEPASAAIPPEPMKPFTPPTPAKPPPSSDVIEALSSLETTDEFLLALTQYSRAGVVKFGKREELDGGAGCYVAICDDRRVVGFLYYDGAAFNERDSKEKFADLSARYKGKRQVWISEIKP